MASNSDTTITNQNTFSLVRQLCVREVTETTKASVLGLVWIALGPLLTMALYVIVFGVLFGGSFDRGENETSLHYALGVYIGLSAVNFISESINSAPFLLPNKVNFVKRIIFPLPLINFVNVVGVSFKWAVNMILALVFSVFLGCLDWTSLQWLILIYFPIFLLSLGSGWIISSLSVYFRDIQHVTPVITQIIFWSSGVFYSSIRVMEYPPIWNVLKWNPVLLAVENSRQIIIWQQPVNLDQLAYLWGVGGLTALVGFFIFNRLKDGFAELI